MAIGQIGNKRAVTGALGALVFSLLAGCGGGGSTTPSPTPAPPPVNRAPAFTSAATANTLENTEASFYQAVATDADGDALSYSIGGGSDASRFRITSGGQLFFLVAPNFDLPSDADGDNVYRVDIVASDGRITTTITLGVTVTNSKEGVAVRRVASGFNSPAAIDAVSDTLLLIAERSGAVYQLNPQTGGRSLLVQVENVGGVGVTAIAAAPDFATTGTFFVMHTTETGFLVLQRYLRSRAGPTHPDNLSLILGINAPQYAGGGSLGYTANGTLFAATGDAGGSGDPAGSAQDANSRLGKIFRITANPDPYAGATVQFFLVNPVGSGLHQPNGFARFQDGFLITDQGESIADEINFLSNGTTITNFGWPFREATRTVRGGAVNGLTDPVVEYPIGAAARPGRGIIGGAIGPSTIASLRQQYIFADRDGAILAVPVASIRAGTTLGTTVQERRTADFVPDQGTIDRPVAIAASATEKMYIVDADGEIFSVEGS